MTGTPRIGPCVGQVGKFLCIGLNYSDHAAESGMAVPKEPILFMKATSCIVGPNDDLVIPRGSEKTDWEVELGVVIGKPAKYVSEADALSHVAGYCVVHDVSERAFQLEGTGQWVKGKSADTFGPIGPWLVTADEIPEPGNLGLWLDVDGRRRQDGSTKTLIFGVDVPGQLHQPLHESAARRHHHDRHASGRRPRPEAARLPPRRQRSAPRRREARRTEAARRGGEQGSRLRAERHVPLHLDPRRSEQIVGAARVLTKPEDVIPYGFDGTAALKHRPDGGGVSAHDR